MAARDYNTLIRRIEAAASLPNAKVEQIGSFNSEGRRYPMYCVTIGEHSSSRKSVMIDAGIHGDEPAGVEAALSFVEQSASNESLLARCTFTVLPCNNPTGWELDTRENIRGIDLNREFNILRPAAEAKIIAQALTGKCFDLVFEMHEDVDSPGFYMYEIADDPAAYIGERIIEAAKAAGYPINLADCIEGAPAKGGLIRPAIVKFRKTRLPLAIHAWRTCGGHVITLEPPASRLSLAQRVDIQLMGLAIAIDSLSAAG